MATENLKELLKEGVTLDAENVEQLTELLESALVEERVKTAEATEARISALTEAHAKELEDAQALAGARVDEAIDVAVDSFIAENESRFVATDEHTRMQALFEAVKTAFEQNAFALNENAAVEVVQSRLDESVADYDSLFERHMELKEKYSDVAAELETAKRAIIFEAVTSELSDTQRERVSVLSENVDFESTEEYATGLRMIAEMEKSKEGKPGEKSDEKSDEDGEGDDDEKEKAEKPKEKRHFEKTEGKKLQEMDFATRMNRYKS